MSIDTLGAGSWFGGWNEIGALNLLIVQSGTPGSGVFLYSGTPGLGNPPIFWASTETTDPYGNTITPTVGVAATGQFSAGFTLINQAGTFIYSAAPAAGNLVASAAPAAGSDLFGNAFLAGVAVYSTTGLTAQLAAGILAIANTPDTWTLAPVSASTDQLNLSNANGALVTSWAPSLMTVTGGPLNVDEVLSYGQVSGGTQSVTFTSSGTFTVPAGVTTLKIEAWGGSGGGASSAGSGAGAGEYAAENASPATPGGTVTITIGAAGAFGVGGGSNNGGNGGNTTTSGGGTTAVTAHGGGGGKAAGSPGGAKGTGSTNSVHHDGGTGGTSTGGSKGGGGGGGAGGSSGAGGNGGNASGNAPGGGGSAGTGGGVGSGGGWGAPLGQVPTNGGAGGPPGGGGGAGGWDGGAQQAAGGAGAKGKVIITYTPPNTSIVASLAGAAGTDANSHAFPAGLMGVAATLINQAGTPATPTGQAVLYSDSNGNVERLVASGRHAVLSDGSGDTTAITVNQAVSTPLTAAWSVPGGDLKTGTKYRLSASGWGIWGSTPQALAIGPGMNGSQTRTETIPSTFLAGLTNFEWSAVYTIMCIGTGVSGHVWLSSTFTISKVGGTHGTDQLSFCVGSNTASTGEAINTTVSNTFGYFASWASTTGTPGIVCVESSFERIGT